jgi:glycolate oxidase FAD binding subunit
MNAKPKFLSATATVDERAILPLPNSRKIHVEGSRPDIQVAMRMSDLLGKPLPVDGACFHGEQLYIRISGSAQAVQEARSKIAGDVLPDADTFWHALREHQLPFFRRNGALYRIVVKPATPPLNIEGTWLLDWGGAQRWLYSNEESASLRHRVASVGGHVTVFRGGAQNEEIFQPLSGPLQTIHRRLKTSFDPKSIFNRGRLYEHL